MIIDDSEWYGHSDLVLGTLNAFFGAHPPVKTTVNRVIADFYALYKTDGVGAIRPVSEAKTVNVAIWAYFLHKLPDDEQRQHRLAHLLYRVGWIYLGMNNLLLPILPPVEHRDAISPRATVDARSCFAEIGAFWLFERFDRPYVAEYGRLIREALDARV